MMLMMMIMTLMMTVMSISEDNLDDEVEEADAEYSNDKYNSLIDGKDGFWGYFF